MKEIKIIFVFILILISQASWSQGDCPELKSKKASKKFDEAMKFLDYASESRNPDNYYKEASLLLVEVKTIEEEYVGSYYYLGYINIKRTDYNLKTAEKYFLKSIELCPDFNPYAYYYLGQIYFGRKEYEKAATEMETFLKYPERIYSDEDINNANEVIEWNKRFDKFYSNPVPFEPDVVKGVSSQQDDYLAIISPDDKMALFTRRTYGVQPKDMAFSSETKYMEKFMYSIRQENGHFKESYPMPNPFNTNENEGGASLTINNKELFYTVCKYINSQDNKPYYNCDICYTKFEHGGWKPIEVVYGINQEKSWDSQPSISSNGNTLFFISDREGGYGGYDIYTATKDEYGMWNEPVNMGPTINTPGNEKSPFIHTDSQTLYFSSSDREDEEGNYQKGHEGLGGYDIFYCRMDKNEKWEKPINIGYPINSKSDDVGFFVSTDGQWGYFGSKERIDGIGGWDLYTFELYKEARPEKVLFISGNVKDIAKDPNSNAITRVEIKNVETKKVTSIPVDNETGDYVAAMVFNSDYVLTVKKPDYVYESKYISQEDTSINTFAEVDVEIEPIEVDKSYQLDDINFATSSSELTKNSLKIIEQFAIFLIENPNIKVSIEGHTDNVGDESSNKILSEERAKAVYDDLIESYKISSSRLAYVGHGESKPIASNTSENGKAKNRRTVFVITEK
jgi:outer membrane protein OmpA-like peptidoglycan-associated protein